MSWVEQGVGEGWWALSRCVGGQGGGRLRLSSQRMRNMGTLESSYARASVDVIHELIHMCGLVFAAGLEWYRDLRGAGGGAGGRDAAAHHTHHPQADGMSGTAEAG